MIHTMPIISTKRRNSMKVISKVSIKFAVEKAAFSLCSGNHLTTGISQLRSVFIAIEMECSSLQF